MKRKGIIIILLIGFVLTACEEKESIPIAQSTEDESKEAEVETETVISDEESKSEIDEEGATKEENTDENSTIKEEIDDEDTINKEDVSGISGDGDIIDIKDYIDVWTSGYGGDLEQQLAEKLGSQVEVSEMGDSYVICDDAIELLEVANNTGYVIFVTKPVENFYIYGVSLGMTEDEAIEILKDQGLKETDGAYTTDIEKYYIEYNLTDGKISFLKYVRRTPEDCAADFFM